MLQGPPRADESQDVMFAENMQGGPTAVADPPFDNAQILQEDGQTADPYFGSIPGYAPAAPAVQNFGGQIYRLDEQQGPTVRAPQSMAEQDSLLK